MKLKQILAESTWGNRVFGDKLPTIEDYQKEMNEAKIKPKQKISKKEWSKIKKFNKHIGQDGTHYVMQLTNKGTALVPVVVEGTLTEKYKPTVTLAKYMGGGKYKPFKQEHFETEDEAKKYIRKMVKKYKLIRYKGYWANPKKGIEMVTNF